jgi:peroxiredoxin
MPSCRPDEDGGGCDSLRARRLPYLSCDISTQRQVSVLACFSRGQTLTSGEIAERLALSIDTVGAIIMNLASLHCLERVGSQGYLLATKRQPPTASRMRLVQSLDEDACLDELPKNSAPALSVPAQKTPDIELDSTFGYRVPLATYPDIVIHTYAAARGIIRGNETPMIDAALHRGFRDYLDDFTQCGFQVVGLSSQPIDKQRDVARRHKLLHALLTDPNFNLADALDLQTVQLEAVRVYGPITLVIKEGWTRVALDPLPTPESHAVLLARWLQSNYGSTSIK